jgi:galactokinase
MPAAIGCETRIGAVRRADRTVTIRSAGMDDTLILNLDALPLRRRNDWSDYASGVVCELHDAGVALRGADLSVTTTIPLGGGLSSSASLEVAVALALLGIAGAELDRVSIARLAQRAEVERVGTRSGIMDQFAVLFGTPECAMLLDTRSLVFEHLRVPSTVGIVICNTMVRRALARGEYNARRAQCEEAVELLRRWYPAVRSLRDVTLERLQAREANFPVLLFRRARHVVSENARVLLAADMLEARDLTGFGSMMNASHASLRDDYEVSCEELDAMVEIALQCDGVYGARMTGGGFGGCTVNLVDAAFVQAFREHVVQAYRRRTGLTPELYDGTPVGGASYADG